MLVIAVAAVTAGSLTVAAVAPLSVPLAIALGPVVGTVAAVLSSALVASRKGEDEQDGGESDRDPERMVALLRGIGNPVAGPSASLRHVRHARCAGRI